MNSTSEHLMVDIYLILISAYIEWRISFPYVICLFFLNATCAFYLFQINRLTTLSGSDYIHLTIERKSDHAKSVQKTRSVPVSATLVTPPTPSHDVTDSPSPWGPTPPRRTRVSSYTSPRYRPTTIHVSSPM